MKILNRLTLKHLAMNKRRTIVTIIGIMLSTSLMVGVGLLFSSFIGAMRTEVIDNYGSYHAIFDNLTKEEEKALSLNISIDKTYSFETVGYAKIDSQNKYKPYLFIASATPDYFTHEDLVEGRLPLTADEIVLPKHLLNDGKVSIQLGDTIELDVGARLIDGVEVYDNHMSLNVFYDPLNSKKQEVMESLTSTTHHQYKVVGFINRSKAEYYSAPGYMAFTTNEKNIVAATSFVEYKNIKKTYENTEEICTNLSKASCETHDALLSYYGVSKYNNINGTLVQVLGIMLGLLSIGCIIVIYNSFAISTMERKKSFGLYSSLGATPKQIRYTVFFEALIVGIVGIILGIIAAFLGIYVLIQVLNYLIADSWSLNLIFLVEPVYIIIPLIFMVLVVFLSAFIPAHRSSKVTSIEMIRENDDIKIPRKKVKTPKFIRQLFGMEGEIALKNMKRNKRKYRITILSLFISIVLFISFGSYLQYGINLTKSSELPKYDLWVQGESKEIEEVQTLPNIDSSYQFGYAITSYNLSSFDKSFYQKEYYQYLKSINGEEFEKMEVQLIVLEDKVYTELQTESGAKENDLLVFNQISYVDYSNSSRKEYLTKIFTNEISNLPLCSLKDEKECHDFKTFLINDLSLKILDYLPLNSSSINIFISEKMAQDISFIKKDEPFNNLIIISNNMKQLYEDIKKKYDNNSDEVSILAPHIAMKQQQNAVLAIKILLYGFISLVTLTGITSVFNTINTSLNLRKKEFAMLRSIGLTPKGFNRMIFFESLFFGLKALLYALPVSLVIVYLIGMTIGSSYNFGHLLIPWGSIIIAVIGVFIITLMTMMYSVRKMKKENILESLRDENI